jgi:fatty-acyl-CoA synthase
VLGVGERGMVQFRAPNVIPGFVDPREDAGAFTADGWLASGDIGWLDEQGLLHLAGRSKDLIIRGGHNIDPRLIEDALRLHPAVQLCSAVGAPDAYAGELPVAFVTLRPGAAATEAELLAFAAARVDEAPAKPKSVTIVERMPVTNVGKVYKPELRAMAAAAVVRATAEEVCRRLGAPLPAVDVEGERVVLRLAGDLDAGAEDALRRALASLPCAIDLRTAS